MANQIEKDPSESIVKSGVQSLLKTHGLQAGVIILLTFIVYIPAMRAGFVFDDDGFLTENPLIKAEDGLYRFWFTTEAPDYFPLVSSSLWIEWRIWGMNATGYHVVNVIWHAINSVLILLILSRLKIPGAWMAALVFAVHPVCVESVAWITERKNTQPMAFYLLTILLFFEFERGGKRRWYFCALFSFLLALLSKTSVVMLPFVLLGCSWWQRGTLGRKDFVGAIPFFVLSGLLGLVTVWFQYNIAIGDTIVRSDNFFSRLAVAGQAVWFYLFKVIFPNNLSFVYPRWEIDTSLLLSYLPLFILLLVFLGIFWWYRKSWARAFLFGLGYFVLNLLPVLGFANIGFMRYSLVADHWQYFSIIGVIALLVGSGCRIYSCWNRQNNYALNTIGVAILALLFLLTWNQCGIYKNEETLWRDTVSKNPNAWLAHNGLGTILLMRGKLVEATSYFSEALRINPDAERAHSNMGTIHLLRRKYDAATKSFSEALRIKPSFLEPRFNLGLVATAQGRNDEALRHFSEALKIKPEFAEAHYNLGAVLVSLGRLEEAIGHFSEALRIRPDFAEAKHGLRRALEEIQKRKSVSNSILGQ